MKRANDIAQEAGLRLDMQAASEQQALLALRDRARKLNTDIRPEAVSDEASGEMRRTFEEWLVWMGHYTEQQLKDIKSWGEGASYSAEQLRNLGVIS